MLELFASLKIPESFYDIIYHAVAFSCILVIAMLTYAIARYLVGAKLHILVKKTKQQWDDSLVQHGFFTRISHAIPAMLISKLASYFFASNSVAYYVTETIAFIYLVLTITGSANAVLNTIQSVYNRTKYATRIPIEGFVQVVKLLVAILAILLIVSKVMDESPAILLSGLGAITAILLLVFKDTILGFVAGINIIANRTIITGDWVEMPQYGANGYVRQVGLTTVKIQNFDKTISTIPTWAFMNDAVKNWRGMSESGGRRIKRTINLDIQSIRFCDDALLTKFADMPLLKDFVAENKDKGLTNVGFLRAYMLAFIKASPVINQDLTLLVRQLTPTETGMPIEMYCFSADIEWASYENIQADMTEHFLAILPEFKLRAFQRESDRPHTNE